MRSVILPERKEQLHNKSEKSNRTSNNYKLLIVQNNNEDNGKRCKFTFFCWDILPTKIIYLGLHEKFDYFLSKFKDQIKMTGSYYINFNDQTFSLQKKII